MFKILIADDNVLIRMGIKNMIEWERFQAVLVGEAGDGEEALELIKKEKPDMVITDIRMPGTDGIYLLNEIRENYPEMITVVISAYNEFDYAREAIRAGSIDYILKPIKPRELNDTILRGMEKSRERKEEGNFELVRKGAYSLIFLRTARAYTVEELESCLTGAVQAEIACQGEIFMLTAPPGEQECRNIRECLKEKLLGAYLLGWGQVLPNESVSEVSKKILAAAAEEIFQQELPDYPACEDNCRDKGMLGLYCSAGDSGKVKDMFHGLVRECLEGEQKKFFEEMQNFLRTLLTFEKADFNRIHQVMEHMSQQSTSLHYVTIGQLTEEVDAVIDELCMESGRISGSKKELVHRVREMIEKNYQSEISLSMAAQLFYVSPAYLSRIFKQETGENLNHYITAVRMKKAKELLENTDKKVIEIAQLVGYSDVPYFTKNYKKYFGYAPNSNR